MDIFGETSVSLLDTARDRYIHYALSVIHARALPDVRDGLKPVQRRILYAMYHNLNLVPSSRYRKSAAVVGEVMAKYHPHGDSAIYEAMVRMAQDFSLLHPLVDGQGNFGSLDGDNAAAMRYTECKLRPAAEDLLSELRAKTIAYRPSYDGQTFEPVVLPAQFPNLLVNGSEGIAVGMATRIPPHALREVIDACVQLLDHPNSSIEDLVKKMPAPDFPTGGEIVSSPGELLTVYKDGQGPVKLRATWNTETRGRKHFLIITSVPYGLIKAPLVEKLGELVSSRKVPQMVDVKDESTTDVRIVIELRAVGDAEATMAFLYRHTPLQSFFHVNLTCLIPTDNPEVCSPARLDLLSILQHWLSFRTETVRKRLTFEFDQLRARIHILAALEIIFDALDEVIRIIRKSEGKRDASEKLMNRFDLDDTQVEAILELKLYRLARLELQIIREELAEKRAEADRINKILSSDSELRALVRAELLALRKQHGMPRRTQIRGDAPEPAYDEQSYIVAEDTYTITTRDGWFKRQGSLNSVDKVRVRDGDAVQWLQRCATPTNLSFLSSAGGAYVLRADTLPATTGHGEPIQRHFAFADRESVVGVISLDARNLPETLPAEGDEEPGPWLVAVSRQGRIVRTPLSAHRDISNRNGRRFMRLEENDAVIAAYLSDGTELVCLATREGQALCYPVTEVPVVKGSAKGVVAIDLKEGDDVLAFELSRDPNSGPTVLSAVGVAEQVIPQKHTVSRGTKGKRLLKKGVLVLWKRPPELLLGDEARREEV